MTKKGEKQNGLSTGMREDEGNQRC